MKRKGKFRVVITVLAILVLIGAAACTLFTANEREEGKNLPIAVIDFKNLNDGAYIGEYEGGMYRLRANKVQVTVSSGRVTDIELLEHKEKQPPEFTDKLYGRVMKAQSLQVDAVSGATITSKAYLKSVENALIKAGK